MLPYYRFFIFLSGWVHFHEWYIRLMIKAVYNTITYLLRHTKACKIISFLRFSLFLFNIFSKISFFFSCLFLLALFSKKKKGCFVNSKKLRNHLRIVGALQLYFFRSSRRARAGTERGAVELRCASYESENGADSGAREVLGKRQLSESKTWWRGLEGWREVYEQRWAYGNPRFNANKYDLKTSFWNYWHQYSLTNFALVHVLSQ